MKIFSHQYLSSFCKDVFVKLGCSEEDATLASDVLINADLRGIDSHGIARLIGYVRLWESKRINVNPKIQIVHQTPSTATLDADKALGLIAAPKAMKIAIEKAKNVGTGWVCVKNSNHFGIAGYHAMLALEHDMIGIAMTNASAIVAPTFGLEKMLGTNPIAVAIPAKKQPAFVADFATTTASNGKLEIAQRQNKSIPTGWAQDKNGGETEESDILKKGGSLLPLGSDKIHGSHKGYALASIVDIFSGVLSGASFGPWAPPFPAYIPMPSFMPGEGLGHFFGAMRIDAFQDAETFKNKMDLWIERMRQTIPIKANEPILIPGDPERLISEERKVFGIPIEDEVLNSVKEIGNKFQIKF